MKSLAIDMDGVCFSIDDAWANHYNLNMERHGHAKLCERPDSWAYYPDLCKTCHETCIHGHAILLASTPMPGVHDGLWRLSQDFDLHLLSHRAPGMAHTARELLDQYDLLQFFKTTDWSWGSKRDKCEELGALALVDDSPGNIAALRGSQVQAIIFDQPYNGMCEGHRAYTWPDVVRLARYISLRLEDGWDYGKE